jgi:hypothetical protein
MARERSGSTPAGVFGRLVLYLSGFDPEQVYARQPDFASRPAVELHHGVAPVAGDVADLAVTKWRGDAFSDGEIGQESLPQSGDVGERERASEVGPLVAPVGDQDTRDAIKVRPADLRDETRPIVCRTSCPSNSEYSSPLLRSIPITRGYARSTASSTVNPLIPRA